MNSPTLCGTLVPRDLYHLDLSKNITWISYVGDILVIRHYDEQKKPYIRKCMPCVFIYVKLEYRTKQICSHRRAIIIDIIDQ